MTSNRWTQLVAVAVAVLCVAGSTLLVEPINQQRVDLQIVHVTRFGNDTPPKYAVLAAAMGTFRGLAADILWYRAEKLKSEGKLFEANTTAQWITTLQPRFGQVWVFQSWNMAYNISVLTHTPQERWDWVDKGIRLLRDEGIVYNPNNVAIYRQLAWIFFHKVGQRADDMNLYYKARLAEEWQELLGVPTEGATTELAIQRFEPIMDAAEKYFAQDRPLENVRDPLTMLYEDAPEARAAVAELRRIGYQPNKEALRAIGRVIMFQRYTDPRQLTGPDGPLLGDRENQIYQLLNDPNHIQGLASLVPFLQAKVLLEDYHMDPKRMYDLMVKFGPLDWRHPASHAIYWAAMGVEKAGELTTKTKIDVLNTDRQIIHGLQMLMHTGGLSYNPLTRWIDTVPDPRFVDAYGDAMLEANERQKTIEWAGKGNTKSFESGHENFLLRAILYSYIYGDKEKSQGYYNQLRDLYGQTPSNRSSGRYRLTLADLVVTEIQNDWSMTDQVGRPFIEMLLIQGFREGLANARYDIFENRIDIARRVEQKLVEERGYANPTAPGGVSRLVNWTSFEQLLGETYIQYMRSPRFGLFERSQVYINSPLRFRAVAYPRFREAVNEQATEMGYNPAMMFPPPPEQDPSDTASKQSQPRQDVGRGTIERK